MNHGPFAARLRFNVNRATVLLDHGQRYRKAQAAAPTRSLRREKWIEDFSDNIGGNARSVVGECDDELVTFASEGNFQVALLVRR